MSVLHLTEANFEEEVLKSDKPVLVDFFATWCGPCKKQGPIVEALAEELTDVKIAKLDVDEAGAIAEKYSIMSIPTLMVFKNGEATAKNVGMADRDALIAMIGQ